MKKVLKFVKGKKDEKRECGGMTPSQSGELISTAQIPEEEGVSGVENGYGYNVDFCGKDKTLTKLHKAAWQGNLEKLKSALKKVEVDATDRHNRTALHLAVAQGHPNIVWFLLGNNAKTSICDDKGHSPLLKAIECGHRECMTLLLDRGANVNVADYTGSTGLHIAISRASFDTASSLLKNAADPDVSNNAGDYPLHIATRLESKDLVELLLGAGAFVDVLDRENRTPLMLAAKMGSRVMAQLFVERGAQLTVVDSNGWTAQDYALLGGHENIASWLSSRSDQKTHSKCQRSDSLYDDTQTDPSGKESVSQQLSRIFDKCSAHEMAPAGREKREDLSESPDAEAIPPYCQPPRSWEIIQAGMIDQNKDGSEPKRRSITALGTLHSRRESFTEPPASSPKSTLSLNRRKPNKELNAFAKNRFSLNEGESLSHWLDEGNKVGKDLETVAVGEKGHSTSGSDWDSSVSAENWRDLRKTHRQGSACTDSLQSHEVVVWSGDSDSGTLGRQGTMLGVEELWVANPQVTPEDQMQGENPLGNWDSEGGSPQPEKAFPPPPTGLELGVDMARSIKCLKGLSVDQSPGQSTDRNPWRNVCERHSLDCPDEREVAEGLRTQAGLHSGQLFKYQKPTDRLTDVSRRINEQLECYDQALRELAESSKKRERPGEQNYYSLPCKGGGRDEWRRMSCRGLSAKEDEGAGSLLLPVAGLQRRTESEGGVGSGASKEKDGEGTSSGEAGGKAEKRRKKHMLLAMREVKHAGQVANSFRTSMDGQVLSPLGKPELCFDSDEKSSPKGISSGSGGNSPADENPFFGVGRQETVLEKNDGGKESEDSETGEESTLWLQDEAQPKEHSDDDVAEIAADEGSKHGRTSSFSPLGVIHREMEEESRGCRRPGQRPVVDSRESPSDVPLCGENEEQNEEIVGEQSSDVSLSSGPIEPLGAEKDSGSEPESSHNDVSPPHNYVFKSQHEWLKSHLKAATSEKNKLEELTAQLTEKAERLQYELADAKEAGKSRDEVIQLLQSQLARMEAAYTKSLEESVQSRLQLTSHEQEILHLKELCYRYQEEKDTAASGLGGDFLQDLQLRIKILEEEKEKMREEITHLEEEKSLLEGQLRKKLEKQGDSEMAEQCRRWKERCKELEEMVKAYASKKAACESHLKEKDGELMERERQQRQQNLVFERKLAEAREENVELRAEVKSLGALLERERRRARGTEKEKEELTAELKRRSVESESELRRVKKEVEMQWVMKLKEKEEEMSRVMAQSERGKEAVMGGDASEKIGMRRWSEGGMWEGEEYRRERERLRQSMQCLEEQVGEVKVSRVQEEWSSAGGSGTVGMPSVRWEESGKVVRENMKLKKEVEELRAELRMERNREGEGRHVGKELGCEKGAGKVKSRNGARWRGKKVERWRAGRRGVGKKGELRWSSMCGMGERRKRGGRSSPKERGVNEGCGIVEQREEGVRSTSLLESPVGNILGEIITSYEQGIGANRTVLDLEYLELKKQILSLESKISNEKNLRRSLENEMIKMRVTLSEKENLEKEVDSLKKKVGRQWLGKSEMELLQYEKDLQAKREKYLTRGQGVFEQSNDYKAKCQLLAKEREKSKQLIKSFQAGPKSFVCQSSSPSLSPTLHPYAYSNSQLLLHPRQLVLHPHLKNNLDYQLDKSIHRYILESPSTVSVSNIQI